MQEEVEIDDLYGGNDDLFKDQPLDPFNEPTNVPEEPKSTKEVLADFDNTLGAKSQFNDPNDPNMQGDLMGFMFRNRGIDPNNIQIEDETGELKSVRFDQLPIQDQYDILFNEKQDEAYTFTPDEEDVINEWRKLGLSPKDYINNIISDSINEYGKQANKGIVSINNYGDDEIYAGKLKVDYPTLSPEERNQMLINAKANPESYKKQVESIRIQLDKKEREYNANNERKQNESRERLEKYKYGQFVNKLNDPQFINMEAFSYSLDDSEKKNIVDYAYRKERNGKSALDNALSNPAMRAKLAYFAIYGDNLLDNLSKNYMADVNSAKRSGYAEGFAKAGGRNTVRYNSSQNTNPYASKKNSDGIVDIDDLNY